MGQFSYNTDLFGLLLGFLLISGSPLIDFAISASSVLTWLFFPS